VPLPTTSRGLCLRFARCSCTKVLRAPRRKVPSSCSGWLPSRRPGLKTHDSSWKNAALHYVDSRIGVAALVFGRIQDASRRLEGTVVEDAVVKERRPDSAQPLVDCIQGVINEGFRSPEDRVKLHNQAVARFRRATTEFCHRCSRRERSAETWTVFSGNREGPSLLRLPRQS
jgi:hypothetical protein